METEKIRLFPKWQKKLTSTLLKTKNRNSTLSSTERGTNIFRVELLQRCLKCPPFKAVFVFRMHPADGLGVYYQPWLFLFSLELQPLLYRVEGITGRHASLLLVKQSIIMSNEGQEKWRMASCCTGTECCSAGRKQKAPFKIGSLNLNWIKS